MADEWQGGVYVRDGAVKLGVVSCPSGAAGAWVAELYTFSELELLGNQFQSFDEARDAVKRACDERDARRAGAPAPTP